MKIIDCNCCIGYSTVNHQIVNHENYIITEKVKQAENADELLDEMNFCGIDSAIVFHQTMFDVSPDYGNRKIVEEVRKYPGKLLPSWTILPSITDEEFSSDRFLKEMKGCGVKSIRAYPDRNRYFLNSRTMGEQLQKIISCNIPVFLSPQSGWGYLYDVLEEFPKLTVVIHNYGLWGSDRYLFPLFNEYPNVYMETSDYQTLGGIENTVNKFGSERLLFGSNFPVNNMGGPIATLLGSNISLSNKENIAFRNIERMLERVKI